MTALSLTQLPLTVRPATVHAASAAAEVPIMDQNYAAMPMPMPLPTAKAIDVVAVTAPKKECLLSVWSRGSWRIEPTWG
ncbi:hypothetical protein [Streptomyces tritici]|uniref:hypothetical protein n=1 Tax=Streptomyces tritici TaxID=2054410 RepID=UPI003AF13C4C